MTNDSPRRIKRKATKRNKTKLARVMLAWTMDLAELADMGEDELTEEEQEELQLDALQAELEEFELPEDADDALADDFDEQCAKADQAILEGDIPKASKAIAKLRDLLAHDDDEQEEEESEEERQAREREERERQERERQEQEARDRQERERQERERQEQERAAKEAVKKAYEEALEKADRAVTDLNNNLPYSLLIKPMATALQEINSAGREREADLAALTEGLKELQRAAESMLKDFVDSKAGIELALTHPLTKECSALPPLLNEGNAALAARDATRFGATIALLSALGYEMRDATVLWDKIILDCKNIYQNRCAIMVHEVEGLIGKSDASLDVVKETFSSPPLLTLRALTGKLLLDKAARQSCEDWYRQANGWCDTISVTVLSGQEVKNDIKYACGTKGKPAFAKELRSLLDYIGKLDASAGDISKAYAAMLQKKGPWSERLKANTKIPLVATRLQLLGYVDPRATELATSLVGGASDALETLVGSSVTLATLNQLCTTMPPAKVIGVLKAFPEDQKLVSFLACQAVTAANLGTLLQANLVVMSPQAHNPFEYFKCPLPGHGGHREAMAALDVLWNGALGSNLQWGVIHVHYCGTQTNPALASTYHVKAYDMADAHDTITNNGVRNAINGKIPVLALH